MNKPLIIKEIEAIDPNVLIAYERNTRTHSDAQIEQVAESISRFGFTTPIALGEGMNILAGHARVQAAIRLGMDEVPCIRLDHLEPNEQRAYIIADNKLAENAGWDEELLRLELGELRDDGFDIDVIGFSRDELDELFLDTDGLEEEGQTDPDEIPQFIPPVSVRSDVWVCGDHRVMCGDSTVITDIETLVGDDPVDMCWTDPPYNVNYQGTAGSIQNDNMGGDEFHAFLNDAFASVFTSMKPGGAIYVAHADLNGLNSTFVQALKAATFHIQNVLIWVKPSLNLGRCDYQSRHEPILYGWKPGAAHRWFGGRAQTTVVEAEEVPFVVTEEGSVHIDVGENTLIISGDDLKVEELVGSIKRHEKPSRSEEHPTMKPVGLIIGYLKNSSRRGDLVIDPFGGSGSTMIAAQTIGRVSRLMELDPKFVDVIVRRWQNFTGLKATLEGSDQRFEDIQSARATKDDK